MSILDKQILTEFINPSQKPLTVNQDNENKTLWLNGIALQGEIENHNGRVYPRNEIESAVKTLMGSISEHGPILGELDHPEGLLISATNASHAIVEVSMQGNDGYAKMKVINAGKGEVVRGIIEAGVLLGVSTRGSGSVDSKGRVSDFSIVTIDIVATPSAPDAFPKPVFESLLYNKEGLELKYLSEIRNDKKVQKYLQKALREYLIKIRDEVVWKR